MKTFHTACTIQAGPDAVWALLTDADGYPSWNTTVDRVDGKISPGSRLTVHTKISPGRAFPVRVSELVSPSLMVWEGGLPFGLFTGVRTFTITPHEGGEVEFSMRETFSGPLSPLMERMIPDLQPVFEEFARALKVRAEGGAPAVRPRA